LNCPFCQSNIKSDNEVHYCKECGTPHHYECWEENGGCTTYGCGQNPVSAKVHVDVGNMTVKQLQELKDKFNFTPEKYCLFCNGKIEFDSVYCKHCGNKVVTNLPKVHSQDFVNEYEERYKEKLRKKRIKYTAITTSVVITLLFIFLTVYLSYSLIYKYFNSEEYKVKRFLNKWEDAWESKDLNKYKFYLDSDYQYIDKSGEVVNREERIKRISASFRSFAKVELRLINVEIQFDSSDLNYVNIKFQQRYISDKINEEGIKTLRLYRGKDTGNEWKVYREWFE